MEVVTTHKYVADDGKEFSSEEACKKWEQQKRVYVLTEQRSLSHQLKILRIFSNYLAALKAEQEIIKTDKDKKDYFFKIVGYVVDDIA